MKTENATCPPDPMLADFGLGKLDAASSDTISQHLETCADCRDRVAGLSGDSFVARLRNVPGQAAGPGQVRQAPGRIDRTFVAGASGAETPRDEPHHVAPARKPAATSSPALGSGPVASAPPELANHPDYELLKELGQGGMGTVYLAKNRMMDRLEVLKVVNKSLLDRPEALERFQQEIRSAARLLHPNIVAAHSVLRPGDLLVFAMEYVRGQDLAQVVKARGQLPVAHAAFYAHQVALGLQHAHEKGMVHRDIKPNNLMLAVEGKKHIVKILDFGLSKATSEKGAEAGLTKSGQILGTPDYVAPEQTLNAQKADIRADIYSLGCTLYHLLSGGPPFQETSLYGILEAHQKREARPLNLVRPDVPVELAAVVAKMMAKDPAKRYQTPAEVARALIPFFKPGQAAATADVAPALQSPGGLRRGTGYSRSGSAAGRLATLPPSSPVAPSIPKHRPLPVATPIPVPAAASVPESAPVVAIDTGVPRRAAFHQHRWWSWWSMLPPWQQRVAVAGASAFLLLLAGVVLFVETKQGTVRIEINDPAIEVVVDGKGATIKGAIPKKIVLEPGRHGLRIKYGELDFETDKFILNRGDTVTLKVELLAGKVRVVQGETLLGERPVPAVAPFDAKQAVAYQEAWANHVDTKVEIVNSLGMKLRLIPPGEFDMGSPPSEPRRREDELQHRVQITKPFFLGVCEVTQKEYETVMENNPCHFSRGGAGKDQVRGLDTNQFPVESVSWDDAAEFCRKLSKLPAEQAAGRLYRLPTEAEWEYACRAGTTTPFHFGGKLNGQQANCNGQVPFGTDFKGPNLDRPAEVGSYAPNPFGLRDMHGNVWEWCLDWLAAYGEPGGGAVDPVGAGTGSNRMYRGGGWVDFAADCRSAIHNTFRPTDRPRAIGFRLALVPSSQASQPGTDVTDASRAVPQETPASAPPAGAANVNPPDSANAPFDANHAVAHQEAWAKHLGTKVEIENALGMKLRLIPPGEFSMGSPQDEIDVLVQSTTNPAWQRWFRSEGPPHRVRLTKAFYLGSCEVTQQEYQEVTGVNPSHFSPGGPGKDAVKGLDPGQHPVEMVNWFDAVDFCNKLSEKEQLPPYYTHDGETVKILRGAGYRLPTEAEWEYACRAGTTTRWSFGDNQRDLAQHAWCSDTGAHTHRVGQLRANPYGLFDMHGNVWEWCWDSYGEYRTGAVTDPTTGPATTGSGRVIRGGAYVNYYASYGRSAFRTDGRPVFLQYGFRVARTIDTKSDASHDAAAGGSAARPNPTNPEAISVNPPPVAIAPFDAKQAVAHQEAWAKHLGTKVEIENSLGMKLRLIPPGEFMMGSPQDEIDALVQSTTAEWQGFLRSEGPRHPVKLTQVFYIGTCEVTQRQYQEVMGINPSHFSPTGPRRDAVQGLDTGQHPVENVSWFDAIDFCNKLSERERRVPYYVRYGEVVKIRAGTGYRLPTEAEWEFACRAGTITRWSFGDTERDLGHHGWFGDNSNGRTQRVGELSANPFGLHDLYGSVSEWCWDWHGDYDAGAVSDPTGPAAGSGRVLRGGPYEDDASFCRSAFREVVDPLNRDGGDGFRVCCGR